MKILKHRIYGHWTLYNKIYNNTIGFKFYNSNECELYRTSFRDGEDTFHKYYKATGTYEIIKNKLIIRYGEKHEHRWIAEIISLYKNEFKLLDINGNNIGGLECYHKECSFEAKKNEIKWYHYYIAVPKEKIFEMLIFDVIGKYGPVLFIYGFFGIIILMILRFIFTLIMLLYTTLV